MIEIPMGAENHIPEPWKAWDKEKTMGIFYPSVSGDDPHIIMLNKDKRTLSCDCKGFWFNGGVCRHVKLLVASVYKRAKKVKKGAQATQVESFLLTQNDLGRRQQEVLACLSSHGPMSNREVSETLGKPINSITGRMNECHKKGFVRDMGVKYDRVTNRNVIVWGLE